MPFQAFSVAGCALQVKISAAFVTIPGVKQVVFNIPDKPKIDVTAISDTSGKSVSGIPSSGTCASEIYWDPTDTVQQALATNALATNVNLDFKVVCSNATSTAIAFSGSVAAFAPNFSNNAATVVPIVINMSTGLTITP